ncbi:hypothetical protein RRG08_013099 [Elysia crispata]|uniref:Uncharacterized protein n=1 Tax=Elysia crispata TaxID=231223 RepID=A0AAE1A0R6_9GAST|nr:hypothetical protein RRG08_013099 [Elysia crispata]
MYAARPCIHPRSLRRTASRSAHSRRVRLQNLQTPVRPTFAHTAADASRSLTGPSARTHLNQDLNNIKVYTASAFITLDSNSIFLSD